MASEIEVPTQRLADPALPDQNVQTTDEDFVPDSWSAPRRVAQRWFAAVPIAFVLVPVDFFAAAAASLAVGEFSPRVAAHIVLVILLFAVGGLYRSRLSPSLLDDLPAIMGRSLVAGAIVTTIGVQQDGSAGVRILYFAGWFALFSAMFRAPCYAAVRALRRAGVLGHRTLIVGCGELGGQLAQTLIDHPEIGLRGLGFIDDEPLLPPARRPIPLLGRNCDLVDVILDRDIGHVIVAFGSVRESNYVEVLRACDRLSCEILFVPRLYEVQAMSRDMEVVWGIPLMRMKRAAFRKASWHLKRLMDILVSAVALVVLSPVLAVVALLVRWRIGPTVLFRQQRVGLDRRPFTLLKFCTLPPVDGVEDADRWNVAEDTRMTRLGRILRRTSLDELPQLWNILRGDMSLVGPRPERPYFVAQFTRRFPRYMARHRVPAGLTGEAQVHGLRGDTSIAERARFDNYYIENWSLWEDVKVLLRTVGQVARAGGR